MCDTFPCVVTNRVLLSSVPFLACEPLLSVSSSLSDGGLLFRLSHHSLVNVQPVLYQWGLFAAYLVKSTGWACSDQLQ